MEEERANNSVRKIAWTMKRRRNQTRSKEKEKHKGQPTKRLG
jgi:hypothetical protein